MYGLAADEDGGQAVGGWRDGGSEGAAMAVLPVGNEANDDSDSDFDSHR